MDENTSEVETDESEQTEAAPEQGADDEPTEGDADTDAE